MMNFCLQEPFPGVWIKLGARYLADWPRQATCTPNTTTGKYTAQQIHWTTKYTTKYITNTLHINIHNKYTEQQNIQQIHCITKYTTNTLKNKIHNKYTAQQNTQQIHSITKCQHWQIYYNTFTFYLFVLLLNFYFHLHQNHSCEMNITWWILFTTLATRTNWFHRGWMVHSAQCTV